MKKTGQARKPHRTGRALAAGAVIILVAVAGAWWWFYRPITLPAPREAPGTPAIVSADFLGAERCAECHAALYAAWKSSTHGRAGGAPSRETVIAPFAGGAIVFANARVTPRVRAGVYEFAVEQSGERARVLRVDGVIGGGHIYGGGTQGFLSRFDDGTVRFLPFEWSRQAARWFCNTNARSGSGWTPITSALRLEECGDWPPVRVLGDEPRFANCQSCHASQATLSLDTVTRRYETRFTSLAINCESCHGPGRRHVELATRGALRGAADVGFTALAAADKDASSAVCYQCHSVKDQLRSGFLSGDTLERYYSLDFPQLGERPLTPDGRVRTFAYQEGQRFSDCYLDGGMTCVSCHDPHDQRYRDAFGARLSGRFDDRQCTSCHASKAEDPARHTRHRAASASCTSCHMPLRQEPETRALSVAHADSPVIPYARSDHTISIPRPRADSALGFTSACASCHAGVPVAEQERQIARLWGVIKPPNRDHDAARFGDAAAFLDSAVSVGSSVTDDARARLRALTRSRDIDLRALALATLQVADTGGRGTRRLLAEALRREGARDAALRARWALALGYVGDRAAAAGQFDAARAAYGAALSVQPSSARLLLSRANAERDAGDYAAAIASYQRSLALDRGNPLGWVNFGIALAAVGDTTASITALGNAAALNPGESLAWFNLANIALVRGELDRARQLYEEAARLDPGTALTHFQLARVALLREDARAALAHLRRGLSFDSSDPSARAMERELAGRLSSGATRH